ncbi:sensor domain-containing diguanylate cyclase [Caballeronia sp. LZ062]|uniref:sensor domain-containing diguanylate cyclase n=1 Tax=unclassified Caballeronia TaxID=2646786 RepID=UPI002865BF08|nr:MULTISPECIES: sensor domain-containing diguanylate cyclase [unclassified Caballeronia]MDR5857781.1 sensor domain-containing diguanylate cyclase [Caballeronia sp. LZ050]MDR5869331.1 sensor domain-containing diguanylate cyclase [Caballeronia sp. LZ062]
MQTSLIHLSSSGRDRLTAAATAAIALIGACLVWPHAKEPGAVIVPFLPIFATWVTLTEGLTAFLLWTQYRISGRLLFATLSGAYAFVSLIAALQLVVFPGVFSPGGVLGAGAQTAVWIWVFWHGGFPALVTVSLAARSWAPSLRDRTPGRVALFGALLLAVGCAAVAIVGKDHLPVVVASGGSYSDLSRSPAALIVEATCLAALGLHVSTTRLRSLMDLWLAVALLAALIDVTLTLTAGARYSVGWYAARVASMLSSSAVLGMLIYETSGLYRELSDAHMKLIESSARDGLTGVFNRAYFDERYAREHALAASSGYPLCVLLIDVDHFKAYNDTFGHLAGDDCLKKVAQALTGALRRTGDFVARYGGEEFVVVLPACEAAAGLAVAEGLRASVESASLPAPKTGAVVTISIGHACMDPGSRQTAKGLLEAADAALYDAKARGRNRVASARFEQRNGRLAAQRSAS